MAKNNTIIELSEYALLAHNHLRTYLIDEPEALYIKGSMTPIANNDQVNRLHNRYKKLFTTTPRTPYIAFKYIEYFIKSYFETMCPYSDQVYWRNKLSQLIKPEYRYGFNTDQFTELFTELIEKIDGVIQDDVWNIYTFQIQGTAIIIEKGIDYRIKDWMTQHGYTM